MLADLTVQQTREHDLDRDEKLAKADKYANDAIATITAAAKPNPQLSDQQWEEAKKDLIAQAHDALGMSALQRKNYDVAITELKSAVDGAAHPEPAFEVRLASAYQQSGKNDEAITLAEKIMAEAQTPQQIKSVAQAIRAAAVVAKNGGKPASQNAPPQIEVKKP
jgi:tetratricopeptide (TPR) repeat protein